MATNLRTSGFTLIELLVTLAVLAIVLAVGVPSFKGMTESSTMLATSSDFGSDLAIARSQALQFGQPVTMCASSDLASCGGAWRDGWVIRTPDGTVVKARSKISDSFSLTGPAQVVFSPSGNIVAVSQWTLCGKPDSAGRLVSLGLAGRPTTAKITC